MNESNTISILYRICSMTNERQTLLSIAQDNSWHISLLRFEFKLDFFSDENASNSVKEPTSLILFYYFMNVFSIKIWIIYHLY